MKVEAANQEEIKTRTKTVPRVFSFRQKEDEQLTKFDEMVHRTLFADGDFERFIDDYKEKLDEEYDEDDLKLLIRQLTIILTTWMKQEVRLIVLVRIGQDSTNSSLVDRLSKKKNSYRASNRGTCLRFGKDSINTPKASRDHFGREIIRLFNEMAGFRDGLYLRCQ